MASPLQQVSQLLDASLDPRQNKQAEAALRTEEQKPGFSLSLLQITADANTPHTTRLAAALFFKNFIKRSWTDEEGNYKLPADEVLTIKRELIALMISCPSPIQAQLGEAVSVIADSDFWQRWDTLVDDLVSRLAPDAPATNNGVLAVAHSIFKRWRPLFRSDELYTEINHVLSKFGTPYLSLFESLDAYLEANKENKENLTQGFTQLSLMIKLMYDLSCHDLPPMIEDNITAVSSLLLKYLTYDNALLHTDDEAEAGLLESVKVGIFEALTLYVEKYGDAFGPYVQQFIGTSWNLLTTIGGETKYDLLVSRALQFLTSVAKFSDYAVAFQDEATLAQITEKVVLPNITLRESDIEMFEDEPIEFIRRDLEGSDSDTRRRAATDFLRQLLEKFEVSVTKVVMTYTEHYLAEYARNPRENWKSKDTAVYLFSAIAAKGATTATHGVKSTNPQVNIAEFLQKYLAADLVNDSGLHPILKVGSIKYLYSFRSLITREQWQEILPMLVKHLGSSEYVIYTYAAVALERILSLTDDNGNAVIPADTISPLAGELLEHLFSLMERNPAPAKVQENEFLMRCAMRVLIVIRQAVVPLADNVLRHLILITQTIATNPSNPRFYYYHFEALGALIHFAAPANPAKFEEALSAPFWAILQNEVTEFMPYVFQLLAALLEVNTSAVLPGYYQSLIAPVLMPVMWENKGYVPALVRLLSSLISRGAAVIMENNQIEPILGIFQKLLASRANETYAFDLLESVLYNFPKESLTGYFTALFSMMLTRLQGNKSEAFALRFVRFYHFVAALDEKKYDADFVVQACETLQTGIFTPIYLRTILPTTNKLARPLDRKIAMLAFAKTLATSSAFAEKYRKGWAYT
ncbi:importin-alpha export receptor, partial [Ascosphaera pollenicola]